MHFLRTDPVSSGNDTVSPTLTALSDGGYVFSYTHNVATPHGTDHILAANIIDSSGHTAPAFQYQSDAELSQLATLSNGNFVAVFQDNSSPGGSANLLFRIFAPDGPLVTAGAGAAQEPDVAALRHGGFVVAWTDGDTANDSDIRATVFSNDGTGIVSNILVNTTTAGIQDDPNVVALADGGFVVTWDDLTAGVVHAQRFNALGTQIGSEFTVGHSVDFSGHSIDATLLADGRFAYAMSSVSGGDTDVVTSIWDPRSTAFQDSGSWTPAGNGSDDRWYSADFNGDGRDDIFRSIDGSGVSVFTSDGSSAFNDAGTWSPAGTGSDNRWYVGDFNGDGRSDTFRYIEGIGNNVLASTGAAFTDSGTWTPAGIGTDNRWYVGDFNGDGRDDVFRYVDGIGTNVLLSTGAAFADNGTWTQASIGSDNRWYVGDFNGDGKDDILRMTGASAADVFLSNGSSFVHSGTWLGSDIGPVAEWYVGDFNGDGRADLMRQSSTGADVFTSDGTQFTAATSWTSANPGSDGHWNIGDYSGDGISDIFRYLNGVSGADVLISA
jgi:hypothetical protein